VNADLFSETIPSIMIDELQDNTFQTNSV